MRYLCTSIVATLALAGTSLAATINVPDDYPTIQEAVNAAVDGDEIVVEPGTYTGTGDEVVIINGKDVTLRSSKGADVTIIDGENERRGISCIGGDCVIEGFSVTNGHTGSDGGGLHLASHCYPVLRSCKVWSNTAEGGLGGGVYAGDFCYPTIEDCIVEGNTSRDGGGIYCYNGLSLTGCSISGNTALSQGGGVWCNDSTFVNINSFTGCSITQNQSSHHGAGLRLSGDNPTTITDCYISENVLSASNGSHGGGVYCNSTNTTFVNCTIEMNMTTGNGGGVSGFYCGLTFVNCSVRENTCAIKGGGLYLDNDSSNIVGTNFSGNNANTGGGIYLREDCSTVIGSCLFSGNTAVVVGGLYADLAPGYTAYISYSTFCENTLPQLAGAWSDGGDNLITELCGLGACCTGNQSVCVESTEPDCEYFGGVFMGYGVECADASCPTSCLGDINVDGEVSTNDLLTVIANWGPCP